MSNFILAWSMVAAACFLMMLGGLGAFLDHRGRFSFLWIVCIILSLAIIGAVPKEWVSP